MKLDELRPAAGSSREAYRKGRGHGSGNGKTAGRGHKGQKARSGGGVRPGFEGGQTPLYRRIPKRGFNNKIFAKVYAEVNVSALDVFEDGAVVDAAALAEAGLIKKLYDGVKILGKLFESLHGCVARRGAGSVAGPDRLGQNPALAHDLPAALLGHVGR